jgi:predicted Na+-dependent transporter
MPSAGLLPDWLLSTAAAATIFAVMFDVGLSIVPGESRWVARHPVLVAKALFSVLVAVPAAAWIVMRVLDLPRGVEVGIMLMSVSPGAPVALRRSIGAGGHRSFAPFLQIAVAALAVISMPLSIAALDEYYAGSASVEPRHIARQVLLAQLVPLAVGMLVRRYAPVATVRMGTAVHRLAGALLAALMILALVDLGPVVAGAGARVALAAALVTVLALFIGHLLGGPEPATRTATAIASAMRNPGLALVVAALNDAPPVVSATIVAYLVASAFTVLAYIAWRKRSSPASS